MIQALFEGVRGLSMPCTLGLVVPAIAVSLASRAEALPAAAFWLAAGLATWAQAATGGFLGGFVSELIAGSLLVGVAIALNRSLHRTARDATSAVAAIAGGIAAWVWEPCVGRAFGGALDASGSEPLRGLLPIMAVVTGALLPLAMLVALATLVPRWSGRRAVSIGIWTTAAIGLLIGFGWYADVLRAMARWSV